MSLDLQHSPFAGRSLIEASAGTGKTWTLTALYVRLLLEKQLSVSQILVVTYTTAATAELRERIRARLALLLGLYQGQPCTDEFLAQLHQQYADDASYRRIQLAVYGFDEAAIFTIHGFCQRALQEAAFEAGGDFDCELMTDDGDLIDEILLDLWRHEVDQAPSSWARFLATKKMTPADWRNRLRSHLGKPYLQVLPSKLEYTPDLQPVHDAWSVAAQRWQAEGAAWFEVLRNSTALKQTSHKVGNLPLWQQELDHYFADPAGQYHAPKCLARLSHSELVKATKKGEETPLHPLADDFEALLSTLAPYAPEGAQRFIDLHVRWLAELNQQLPQRKAEQRVMAFDDLLNRLNEALQREGLGDSLAHTLREQYPVALIDEFQDTDPIQYCIFDRIYAHGSGADLCFVGDPKQAIYAFRGADLATYLQAREATERKYNLPTNHRSTPELIATLNTLFDRPQLFSDQQLDYPPVNAANRPRAQLVLPEPVAAVNAVWLGDEELTKGQANDLAAEDCARRITQLLTHGEQGSAYFAEPDGTHTALRGGDVAVLVASHRQAALVADALTARGVPSVRKGRESVWQSEEAHELAAVLAAYLEPSREGALRCALLTRLLGRNVEDLARSQQIPQEWDRERELAEYYHTVWRDQGFMRWFRLWLDEQSVAVRLLARADGERRLTNLLHLAELLQTQSIQFNGIEPLCVWFEEQRQRGGGEEALLRLESDAERVQIVTIHTSKGLEYPLVFCPFLWDGRLLGENTDQVRFHGPEGQSVVDFGSAELEAHVEKAREESFAEQLRLLYVALTRARDHLWLHWGAVQLASDKDEGLHSSALAWLLHGRSLSGEQPMRELQAYFKGFAVDNVRAEIDALEQLCAGHFACVPLADEARFNEDSPRSPEPQHLSTMPRMGSFSGLTAGQHREAPDRDASDLPVSVEVCDDFFAFPRGARPGSCLHAIMEDWARDKGLSAERVTQRLEDFGIDSQWQPVVYEQLQQVLNTALTPDGLTLNAIAAHRRLPELEFTFPVDKLNAHALRTALGDPASGLPEPLRQAASTLRFDTLKGFLKGFIDLTFEYQGRWYIADYKSNWLGHQSADYQVDALEQALAREHYYLQYLIYLTALRRFLRLRLADFTDDLIGGAFYLFLRGMPNAGVYWARPDAALLERMDQLLRGEGV